MGKKRKSSPSKPKKVDSSANVWTGVGVAVAFIGVAIFFYSDPVSVLGRLLSNHPSNHVNSVTVTQSEITTPVEADTKEEGENLSQRILKAYEKQIDGHTNDATALFEELLLDQQHLSAHDHRFVFTTLGRLYFDQHAYQDAIRVHKLGLQTRRDDTPANLWYGNWLRALLDQNLYDDVRIVGKECLDEFRSMSTTPFYCYHILGMTEIFDGNRNRAEDYFRAAYKQGTAHWHDSNGDECLGTFVPLNLDTDDNKARKLKDETIQISDLTVGVLDELSHIPQCSKQQWPLYMINRTLADSYSGHRYYEMGCYPEKTAVLNVLRDVHVHGTFKIISKETAKGECTIYTPGYMYVNINSFPVPVTDYELQLPIKKLENAIFLHPLDINYFHATVEGIPKVILALHHPDLQKIPNLRILHKPNPVITQYFELLGVSSMLEAYEPEEFRYSINNLYSIDWHLDITQGGTFHSTEVHFKDLFSPPAPVLQLTRSVLSYSVPNMQEPRNLVIFLHRESGGRSIEDTHELYEMAKFVAESRGLEFVVHGANGTFTSVANQISMFSRAIAVIGVHGAGFANIINCKEGTHIIEIPVFPVMVSVYSRISSMLNFKYYTLPNVLLPHYRPLQSVGATAFRDIDNTLQYVLESSGYHKIQSNDPATSPQMLSVAKTYLSKDLYLRGVELLEEIIAMEDASEPVRRKALQLALDVYYQHGVHKDIVRLAQNAIETLSGTEKLHRWYGYWAGSSFQLDEIDTFKNVTRACIKRYESILGEEPVDCYSHMAKVHLFEGNLKASFDLLMRKYQILLSKWRDHFLLLCPSVLVPLSINEPENLRHIPHKQSLVVNPNLTNELTTSPCSTQQWPIQVSQTGERAECKENDWDIMKCFTNSEQKTVLYRLQDVYVRDNVQLIYHKEGNQCYNYVSEFPYPMDVTFPHEFSQASGEAHISKPLKEINNAMLFHYLPESYHHILVVGLPKLILALQSSDVQNISEMKILVRPNKFIAEYFELLGVSHMLEAYEPHLYRYHVTNLYSIEWMFEHDLNQLFIEKQVHFADFYVPPPSVLQLAASTVRQRVPAEILKKPRNVIVALHRLSNDRAILNPTYTYQMLGYVAQLYGLELKLQGAFADGESLNDKMEMFHRAVAVVGVHGEGFSNMMFCQEGTAMIELPVYPSKVSVYSRMASILHFPYYSVPSALSYHYGDLTLSNEAIYALEQTLYDALHSLGLSKLN